MSCLWTCTLFMYGQLSIWVNTRSQSCHTNIKKTNIKTFGTNRYFVFIPDYIYQGLLMSVWKLSNVSCLSKFTVYEFEHDIENKT